MTLIKEYKTWPNPAKNYFWFMVIMWPLLIVGIINIIRNTDKILIIPFVLGWLFFTKIIEYYTQKRLNELDLKEIMEEVQPIQDKWGR